MTQQQPASEQAALPRDYDADASTITTAPTLHPTTDDDEKKVATDDSATDSEVVISEDANAAAAAAPDASSTDTPAPSKAESLSTVQIALLMSALCVCMPQCSAHFFAI